MRDNHSALEHALGDGEDFELLFAVSPEDGRKLLEAQPVPGIILTHVGECIAEPGLFLEEGGKRSVLKPMGYVHSF
jgi:thiamine-monophosphate kinase